MRAGLYIFGSALLMATGCAVQPGVDLQAGGAPPQAASEAQPAVVEDGDARIASPEVRTSAAATPLVPVTVAGSPLATKLGTVIAAEMGSNWQVVRTVDLVAGDSQASLVDVKSNDGQYLIIHLDKVATPAAKTRMAMGRPGSMLETKPNGDSVVRSSGALDFIVLVHGDGRRVIVDQSFKHKTTTPAPQLERLLQVADGVNRSN